MSTYKWLLDAGHGGMTKEGLYTTSPAKMHVFDDGLTFYEGVNNRAIMDLLIESLTQCKFDYELVYDAVKDTPLSKRVSTANKIQASTDQRCIYLSIHSDAMPEGKHGKGSGVSIYTSKGQTKSDIIADIFADFYTDYFDQFKFRQDRTDGDADKEEDFYVLRKTNCPAILIENLFFDNRREAEFLLSDAGRAKIAEILFLSISYTEHTKPI
ncbi:MAG: N-acetylmuramoyl-L-alanine amidase [Cyclobacteriaceae bacterium]|nr:N-acetylmuramoyl-L-alanine amidase [Cyclobacteriaceae bacterium]